MRRLPLLLPTDPPDSFPPVDEIMDEPHGLLAAGGDLSSDRLLSAYRQGIFPWYEEGQPILWWCPDPRAVFYLDEFHVSRSLRKTIRQKKFSVTVDENFQGVIEGCAKDRPGQEGTWITRAMKLAYIELHNLGHAHSVEVWRQNELVGGIYGVSIGKAFFGESMFSNATNASKVALDHLVQGLKGWDFGVIDCQMESQHLNSLGSRTISRKAFSGLLEDLCANPGPIGKWRFE
ncbi:MAG: leucyl/phenylalanyl-tRNA--protein transferase [Pseudomonadota bacterium]